MATPDVDAAVAALFPTPIGTGLFRAATTGVVKKVREARMKYMKDLAMEGFGVNGPPMGIYDRAPNTWDTQSK
ncbi:MAG: hypothetical protein IIB09_09580 [Bacteroidetes bacterium]|nr:hypothetical protein [Bacteroidota bacterium]